MDLSFGMASPGKNGIELPDRSLGRHTKRKYDNTGDRDTVRREFSMTWESREAWHRRAGSRLVAAYRVGILLFIMPRGEVSQRGLKARWAR